MTRSLLALFLFATLVAAAPCAAQDEDPQASAGAGASQQVEESDEAYRRRMELEDARRRDPTYVDAQGGYQRELEKVDHLPEASRDHIREQLIDVIMENGEWTPGDARRDYPYAPSPAAQDDSALAQREQEAWDEQIEKYHAREAAAFGARRAPVGRAGDPSAGADGGAEGSSAEAGGAAEGQSGEGAPGTEAASQSTYSPYDPARQADEERASTAGVSQSALDFILGRRGTPPAETPPGSETGSPPAANAEASTAPADDSERGEEASEAPPDMRGILAIEDLDKLGDSVRPAPPPEEDESGKGSETPPDDG